MTCDSCAARKEQQNTRLRDEKSSLAEEVDELKSKVQRMGTMSRQVCTVESLKCSMVIISPFHLHLATSEM